MILLGFRSRSRICRISVRASMASGFARRRIRCVLERGHANERVCTRGSGLRGCGVANRGRRVSFGGFWGGYWSCDWSGACASLACARSLTCRRRIESSRSFRWVSAGGAASVALAHSDTDGVRLCVGRLNASDGADLLIGACALMAKRCCDVYLRIVGGFCGKYRSNGWSGACA